MAEKYPEALDDWTGASWAADAAMEVPRGLMGQAKPGRGAPSTVDRHLFMAALTFTYAVWESYVEDVAVELVHLLADTLEPDRIPESARTAIMDGATSWELSVHPGWRGLWTRRVEIAAKGDDSNTAGSWGLNTANQKQVRNLFKVLGIDALPQKVTAPDKSVGTCPPGINDASGFVDVRIALERLVSLRGSAVHTASLPESLRKGEVVWLGALVENLYEETDKRARDACRALFAPLDGAGEDK